MDLSAPSPRPRAWPRRVWAWRHDVALKTLYANAAKQLSGSAVSALIGLGTIWFASAALGLWQFGILTVILSFVGLLGNTSKFSTWEAVVKYGADDLARGDREAFRRLIAFSMLLDAGTAAAALAICAALAWLVLPLIQVPGAYLPFALFLCLSALFTVGATSVGVLRLFGRFGLIAVCQPVGPLVRLGLCALGYSLEWDLWAFGAAYLASSAVDVVLMQYLGWRELGRQGLRPGWHDIAARHTAGHPGLWTFVLANNGRLSLGILARQSDDLVVGIFAGPAGAALWRIAKQVASILSGPARLFVISVFPQLARLWSAGDYRGFRRLVLRSSITSGVGAVVVLALFSLVGQNLLELFFHKDTQRHFVDAFVPSLLLMGARTATMAMSPFLPALTAMGRAARSLKLTVLLTLLTVPLLVLLTWLLGIVGAGLSRVVAEALTAGVFGWTAIRAINWQIRRAAASTPAPVAAPDG